ncbi:Tetracyclin repressor domain protein [Kribbella flavida DSM 17836]|uniref:Tetracyclin repressor domain protein n=1 Tax=Kribbella flavida (strain DSM 17836 / JCM 10339 / NBRC 14399) TaxID=479435 RepID=D2PZJ4_KRIFD|nr:TetR/AcrR family transcriptional regulator C-terminal domain-containing protein [Kribbella flavida]ADB35560.1 Tetracyclin repressor domain protein [Kribbella flavida DSM 17836]
MAREADERTALGSVWLRSEPAPTRAPLDRQDIVRTAVQLLDRDGLEQLSMRRLATELGTAATSALYWRVATKNDLLELAVDEVFGEALLPADATAEPPGRSSRRTGAGEADWRDRLGTLAKAAYDAFARHPWAPQLLASHAGLGPNYQAYAEQVVSILASAGFKGVHLDAAVSAVFHYLVGAAVTDAAWTATVRRSGLPGTAWAHAAGDRLGVPAASLTSYLSRDDQSGPEARFTTGLRVILVGLRPRRL